MRSGTPTRLVALVLALGPVGCNTEEIEAAHKEIISARSVLRSEMTAPEVEAAVKGLNLSRVVVRPMPPTLISVRQKVLEGSAKEWVLWVSFSGGKTAGARIRTVDSEHEHPEGAPPDLIWAPEDQGTPWSRTAS